MKARMIGEYDPNKMVESVMGIQNLRIVELNGSICKRALKHVKKYGLELEDAIHLETALRHNCREIFSADADFDRSPLKRRFK